MKKQGVKVKARNSGNYINYKDYSNSTLVGMVTSSSVGTSNLDFLAGKKLVLRNSPEVEKRDESRKI